MRTKGTWNNEISSYDKIEKAYNNIANEVGNKYRDIAAQEGRSIILYLDKIDHDTMKSFAEKYDLEYLWEARNEY